MPVNRGKRNSPRSKCLFPAQVIKASGRDNLIERATVHDFSANGLKLFINFNVTIGSDIELKLFVPERNLMTSLTGEIVWIKHAGNKLEAGLRIKELDPKAKQEILEWVFPSWAEEEYLKEEKKK